jgi:hypothetical protein
LTSTEGYEILLIKEQYEEFFYTTQN